MQHFRDLQASDLIVPFWLLSLLSAFTGNIRAIGDLAGALVMLMYLGYPCAIILGVPAGVVRPEVVRRARWIIAILCAAAIAALAARMIMGPGHYTVSGIPANATDWGVVAIVLFGQGLLVSLIGHGSAALGDISAAAKLRRPGDSLVNFFNLLLWPYGGAVRVQRILKTVPDAA
jgi:hypothetical protein